jgi:hypothetical protein
VCKYQVCKNTSAHLVSHLGSLLDVIINGAVLLGAHDLLACVLYQPQVGQAVARICQHVPTVIVHYCQRLEMRVQPVPNRCPLGGYPAVGDLGASIHGT